MDSDGGDHAIKKLEASGGDRRDQPDQAGSEKEREEDRHRDDSGGQPPNLILAAAQSSKKSRCKLCLLPAAVFPSLQEALRSKNFASAHTESPTLFHSTP